MTTNLIQARTIPFIAPMVLSLLAGRKRITRRPLRDQDPVDLGAFTNGSYLARRPVYSRGELVGHRLASVDCPYGLPGDVLRVREAWRTTSDLDPHSGARIGEMCLDAGYSTPWAPIQYEADGQRVNWSHTSTPPHDGPPEPGRYRHARFMPGWASRIKLSVTSVRVEPLQAISEADAIAEGIEPNWTGPLDVGPNGFGGKGWVPDCGWRHYLNSVDGEPAYSAVESFRSLWESINGPGSWDTNPLVWVVGFGRAL